MQRWLFFLFVNLVLLRPSYAQVDIVQTEVSIWVKSLPAQQMEGQVTLELLALEDIHQIILNKRSCTINWVRKKEGRLKEKLNIREAGSNLIIQEPLKKGEQLQVVIRYQYKLKDLDELYVTNKAEQLVLNPVNLDTDNPERGAIFYPCIEGDKSQLNLNITAPKKLVVGYLGELEFSTNNGDDTYSYYTKTGAEYFPHQLFITIGTPSSFKKTEMEDKLEIAGRALDKVNLEQELKMRELDLAKMELQKIRDDLNGIEGFTGYKANDEEVKSIDSLAELSSPLFFLGYEDIPNHYSRHRFDLEKQYLIKATGGNSDKASDLHFEYYGKLEGLDWKRETIISKFNNRASDSLIEKRLMGYYVDLWLGEKTDSIFLNFGDSLKAKRVLPYVKVDYRYRNGYQNLWVSQDTMKAPLYLIPFTAAAQTRNGIIGKNVVTKAAYRDTILIAVEESPQAVWVHFGDYFPGDVTENRPDIYNLYDLRNAESDEEKGKALERLMQAKNKNLVSTAIGIALDDPSIALKLKALKQAQNLNKPGQLKLKSTLIRLAYGDYNAEIKAKAQELVNKYYN